MPILSDYDLFEANVLNLWLSLQKKKKKTPSPIWFRLWTNREVVETAENWSRKLFQFDQNRATTSSVEWQTGTRGVFSTLHMLWKTVFVNWKADIHCCQPANLGVEKNCLVPLTNLSLKVSVLRTSALGSLPNRRVFINPTDSWWCLSSQWTSKMSVFVFKNMGLIFFFLFKLHKEV